MFIYNNNLFPVNFSGLTTLLLPPLLRQPSEIAWMTALAYPIQRDNILLNEYISGSTYPVFTATTTYFPGDRVINTNDAIFENLTGSTGVYPNVASGATTWLQVNPTFIGAEERSCYNSQKITLEYALNREYQILPFISNQLIWTGANHTNQIYIENNDTIGNRFIISTTNVYSSTMSKTGAIEYINGGKWMGRTFTGLSQTDFTVWVPNLTLYPQIVNSNVSAYTQNYVIAGIVFDVKSY